MRKAVLHIVLIFISCASVAQQNQKTDSSQINKLLIEGNSIANYYPDSALLISEMTFTILEKIKKSKSLPAFCINELEGKIYGLRGDAFCSSGNYSKSHESLLLAKGFFNTAKTNGLDTNIYMGNVVITLNRMGILFSEQAKYPEALEYHFEALKITEKTNNELGLAKTLSNVAGVYYAIAEFEKSLKYYFNAVKKNTLLGRKRAIASCYGNIGTVYKQMNNFDSAAYYYQITINMFAELGDDYGKARGNGNLANLYREMALMPQYASKKDDLRKKALEIYFTILDIFAKHSNRVDLSIAHGNIGQLYVEAGQFKLAEYHLKKALSISSEIGAKDIMSDHFDFLATLYSISGNHKLALEYYKLYIVYRDSLVNEENTKKTVQLEMQYEFDKKEAATKAEQEVKDAKATADKKQQNIILLSVSGVLLLVVGFAFFIYRNLRVTQKQKLIIEQQKQTVENQKQLVEEKQKEIIDSIRYAKRIQDSLLPSEKYIERNLNKLK